MDQSVTEGIRRIFDECRRLSHSTGRPFSPDGHLVGSLGEVFAASELNLRLMAPSNKGFDAVDSAGIKVEIKATTRSSIALSASGTEAKRLVVIKFNELGKGTVVYDGASGPAWDAAGPPQKNGARQISLSALSRISDAQRTLFD